MLTEPTAHPHPPTPRASRDLRLDEALLKVGVDDSRSLGGRRALLDGPGAGLLRRHLIWRVRVGIGLAVVRI
jgi:hypothetical protein